MRYQGRVTSWKQDRGFGFISPIQGGDQVFVHISSFANRRRSSIENEVVTYLLRTDAQGRPQAHEVLFLSDRAPATYASLVALLFFVALSGLVSAGRAPLAVLAFYLVASLAAILAYARDKSAAHQNAWRTSEATLHVLGLIGGWPGALVARHFLRHKTKKWSFIVEFWGTVVLNLGALIMLLSPAARQCLLLLLNKI